MKNLFIFFILVPTILLSQENKKNNTQKNERQKVDGWSGATYMNKEKQIKGSISGKVKKSKNQKALEFATVSLKNSQTNKIVEGTITDAKGRFYFNEINVGEYKISIKFIGYKEQIIPIETSKRKPDLKIKEIYLEEDRALLSEVTIEEEKAIYETKIDKIVYNAENDLNETESDATDVLRKAPLLSVDLDGNVSLRGSRNIKFLVNGKASSFFSSDVSSALQMIPADQIKTIEVITSPGAKYEGEGDAGIVNIITKKAVIDGYNASINTMASQKMRRGGLNLNLGKGRFGLSTRAGTYGSWPGRVGTDTYERINWDNIDASGAYINPDTLIQYGESENYFQGYRGSINAYYDLNAYNSFNSSIKFGGKTNPIVKNSTIEYSGSDTSYIGSYNLSKTDRTLNMEWTTDYTKKFADNEEKELVFAFQLGGDINDGNTDIDEDGSYLFNQNDETVIEETIQIDYTYPFGKSNNKNDIKGTEQRSPYQGKGGRKMGKSQSTSSSNKLEIGGKIINRDREIVYSDQVNSLYVRADEFNYNQLVASSYISTEFSLPKKFGLKTGLRYELTGTSGDWKNSTIEAFEKKYQNILPSVIFSKSFSPMRSIKLSYNQRIRRPGVRQINSNIDKEDNRNITIGNPELEPTVTQQYEFAINSFGKILQRSVQIYYKHSLNVIESFIEEINGSVSVARYKNIGESKQLGANVFGSIKLRKLNFRGSIDVYNYSGRDQDLGYQEWTEPVMLYSYFMGGSYDLGKNWKAETFGFYRSPTQSIQGTVTSFSMMSVGIKKTLKNKRGSFGLRFIEPFNKNKEFISDLDGELFTQSSVRTIPFRSIGISFKYTIGKLNFKDGSKKTNINNDDIQEDSSNEY